MPARIIIVYILMGVRALVNAVFVIRVIGTGSIEHTLLFSAGIIELGFSTFVLIALAQRKYLAIQVFRPYIVISGLVTVTLQAFSAIANAANGVPFAFAQPIGGAVFLLFVIWFQWYVADEKVRAYLSTPEPADLEPPPLP